VLTKWIYTTAAVDIFPKIAPAAKGADIKAMIQAKGCHSVHVSAGTDGSGHCTLKIPKGQGKGTMDLEIDGVSTGCCNAGAGVMKAKAHGLTVHPPESSRAQIEASDAAEKAAACHMIGACGKQDQLSMFHFAKGMMGGKGGGPHPGQLELLETFNMTNGGAQQMMATFLTSEAEDEVTEDDVTEDDATEDGSQIVTGILGFVAGAAVTGLGVTVLRRRTPSSQDEYNEIVA